MESVTFDRFATVTHQPNVKVELQMNNCEFQTVKENMWVLYRMWRWRDELLEIHDDLRRSFTTSVSMKTAIQSALSCSGLKNPQMSVDTDGQPLWDTPRLSDTQRGQKAN